MNSTISSNQEIPHTLPPGRTRDHRGVPLFAAYAVTIAARVAVRLNTLLLKALIVLTTGVSFAQSPEEEVSGLIAVLQDDDKTLSSKKLAISDLGKHGRSAAKAIPLLEAYLQSQDFTLRNNCLATLGKIGEPAVPLLRSVVRGEIRIKHPPVPSSGPQRAHRLNQDLTFDLLLRSEAIKSLATVGVDAQAAVPDLLAAIRQQAIGDERILSLQLNAVNTLAKVVPDREVLVVPLCEFLTPRYDPARGESKLAVKVFSVLQDIGPKAKASTPTIISYLERELHQRPMDVNGCRHAVLTLRCIGPDASQALPLLRSILRQDERGHFHDIIEQTIEVVKGAAPVSELPGYLKRQ